jgi:type I restriction enzyme S subunit
VSELVTGLADTDLKGGETLLKVQLGEDGPTPYLPLADVAPLVRRVIAPEPNTDYTELGVRSFNKGTFHRRTVKGAEFTWQELYQVRKNDLVFSNIMAWEGAVALAGLDDDGCIGNHRMLTCACDETRVNPAFLAHYFKTPEGMAKLVGASTGTVARNRTLTATALGGMTVPVPPLGVQGHIVRHLELLTDKAFEIERHMDAIERDAEHLLALRFRDAIANAQYRPMAEVAPLVRRTITIEPDRAYTELGVRSFFKGAFHRRTVPGSDFSWQDIYQVRANDLIFSNIMAWEQAIAIATQDDDGCVGNHRMLTCEANAEAVVATFLWYYFTTEEGFAKVYAASPGTAARNRTMTAPALMAIEVPTPPLPTQQTFARLQSEVAKLKARHSAIREANSALAPATLERVFAGHR